jgi:hypothetical protein
MRKVAAIVTLMLTLLIGTPTQAQFKTNNEKALGWAYLSSQGISTCYVARIRAVNRQELAYYQSLLAEIESEITRRQPSIDPFWIWQDATNMERSPAARDVLRVRDPIPPFCHRMRLLFASVYWYVFPKKCPAPKEEDCDLRQYCGVDQMSATCTNEIFAHVKKKFPEFFRYSE